MTTISKAIETHAKTMQELFEDAWSISESIPDASFEGVVFIINEDGKPESKFRKDVGEGVFFFPDYDSAELAIEVLRDLPDVVDQHVRDRFKTKTMLPQEYLIYSGPHSCFSHSEQRIYRLPNGYGLSCVNAPELHSYPFAWEIAVLDGVKQSKRGRWNYRLVYDTPLTDDVVVFGSDEEAAEWIEAAFSVLLGLRKPTEVHATSRS